MVHIDKRQLNLKIFFAKDMQWKWVCVKLSGSCDVTSNRQSIDERKFFLRFYFRKTESPELRRYIRPEGLYQRLIKLSRVSRSVLTGS